PGAVVAAHPRQEPLWAFAHVARFLGHDRGQVLALVFGQAAALIWQPGNWLPGDRHPIRVAGRADETARARRLCYYWQPVPHPGRVVYHYRHTVHHKRLAGGNANPNVLRRWVCEAHLHRPRGDSVTDAPTKPLRILAIAPTPFFVDRGGHVQIYEQARALIK